MDVSGVDVSGVDVRYEAPAEEVRVFSMESGWRGRA
jgi:hypothetical protein